MVIGITRQSAECLFSICRIGFKSLMIQIEKYLGCTDQRDEDPTLIFVHRGPTIQLQLLSICIYYIILQSSVYLFELNTKYCRKVIMKNQLNRVLSTSGRIDDYIIMIGSFTFNQVEKPTYDNQSSLRTNGSSWPQNRLCRSGLMISPSPINIQYDQLI